MNPQIIDFRLITGLSCFFLNELIKENDSFFLLQNQASGKFKIFKIFLRFFMSLKNNQDTKLKYFKEFCRTIVDFEVTLSNICKKILLKTFSKILFEIFKLFGRIQLKDFLLEIVQIRNSEFFESHLKKSNCYKYLVKVSLLESKNNIQHNNKKQNNSLKTLQDKRMNEIENNFSKQINKIFITNNKYVSEFQFYDLLINLRIYSITKKLPILEECFIKLEKNEHSKKKLGGELKKIILLLKSLKENSKKVNLSKMFYFLIKFFEEYKDENFIWKFFSFNFLELFPKILKQDSNDMNSFFELEKSLFGSSFFFYSFEIYSHINSHINFINFQRDLNYKGEVIYLKKDIQLNILTLVFLSYLHSFLILLLKYSFNKFPSENLKINDHSSFLFDCLFENWKMFYKILKFTILTYNNFDNMFDFKLSFYNSFTELISFSKNFFLLTYYFKIQEINHSEIIQIIQKESFNPSKFGFLYFELIPQEKIFSVWLYSHFIFRFAINFLIPSKTSRLKNYTPVYHQDAHKYINFQNQSGKRNYNEFINTKIQNQQNSNSAVQLNINFQPFRKKSDEKSNLIKNIEYFSLNLNNSILRKNKLFKYLNIYKQKEYYKEQFRFRTETILISSIISPKSQNKLHFCISILEEMQNFYISETKNLTGFRNLILFMLHEYLLENNHTVLSIICKKLI